MNWKQAEIDLGVINVNQTVNVIFDYIGNHPELIKQDHITASCGCSKPIWDDKNNLLIVNYTPNPIPLHLKSQGKHSYNSNKYILVNYGNGEVDKLIFTAIVTK